MLCVLEPLFRGLVAITHDVHLRLTEKRVVRSGTFFARRYG